MFSFQKNTTLPLLSTGLGSSHISFSAVYARVQQSGRGVSNSIGWGIPSNFCAMLKRLEFFDNPCDFFLLFRALEQRLCSLPHFSGPAKVCAPRIHITNGAHAFSLVLMDIHLCETLQRDSQNTQRRIIRALSHEHISKAP
jgi:hypothetical protein